MQPHFFPWSGYFNLIGKCDIFIFLDDAQFSKNSWQVRNKILINKKIKWITVETKKSSLKTKIFEKEINHNPLWKKKMIKTILQNYSSFPGINDLKDLIREFENDKSKNLADLNINLIKFVCKKILIKTQMIRSSDFQIDKKRTDKIIDLLKLTNSTSYLSAVGAKDYLIKDNFKKKIKVDLFYNDFKSSNYNNISLELHNQNLSIIDVVANLGWINTEDYVKSQKFK